MANWTTSQDKILWGTTVYDQSGQTKFSGRHPATTRFCGARRRCRRSRGSRMTEERATSRADGARALRVYLQVVVAGGRARARARGDCGRPDAAAARLADARGPRDGGRVVPAELRVRLRKHLHRRHVLRHVGAAVRAGPATVSMAARLVHSWRRRKPYRQIAFNTAAPALSIWAGAQAFF